jgi:WhiB family transcriptional regulator, redox-sensing transcriptional regulator
MTASANWRGEAACLDADTDLFFPVGPVGPALRQVDEAKRICRTCPVQARCLAWALDHGVTDGVWGGTTEDERRTIRWLTRKTQTSGKMTMAMVVTQQTTENMEYVRKLLKQKQPGFAAALELAVDLLERDLMSPKVPRDISTPADP